MIPVWGAPLNCVFVGLRGRLLEPGAVEGRLAPQPRGRRGLQGVPGPVAAPWKLPSAPQGPERRSSTRM